MKRLFVTGASGMLGSYVASQAIENGWSVTATYSRHPVRIPGCSLIPLDIADAANVSKAVTSASPDVIIHTAAQAKPDVCEQNKRLAFDSNVLGTYNITRAAEAVNARVVHISTDSVFSGEKNPYKEDDPVSPISYYGLTKAAGEAAVRSSTAKWAIVRTSIIFGPRKFEHVESFSDKVIDALRENKPIKAYVDQYRCPIPAWNLAEACLEIAERALEGIFHVECPDVTSRFEWARKIAQVFGFDESLIEPMYMDSSPGIAPRSKSLVLDVSRTIETLHTRLLTFEESMLELHKRSSI